MVEPASIAQLRVQRVFPGMPERWVAEIVREAERFGEILVEAERPSDCPADLRDFEAVRQPDAIMVSVGSNEDLGLVP
jgi:hypothetical protein